MEVDGKFCIAVHARMWYIYMCVLYVHNPGVHGRFYGLDLKKELASWKVSHGGCFIS